MTSSTPAAARTTPEFLLWSLARRCPLREADLDVPAAAHRELRNLRAFAEARAEDRIEAGWCVRQDSPGQRWGFPAEEVLAYYGGVSAVEAACGGCEANICLESGAGLAGCYGILPVVGRLSGSDIRPSVEAAILEQSLLERAERQFLATAPAWYGLWATSPLTAAQLEILIPLLGTVCRDPLAGTEVQRLNLALRAANEHELPLFVECHPAGEVRGRRWFVEPHCPRCQATTAADWRFCRVCRRQGGPLAARRRMAMGERPYRPLNDEP